MGAGPARLVVVGTPIGNLEDVSPRAVAALRGADVIACEDTRRTGRLLVHLGIPAPRLVRFDDHTEPSMAPSLLDRVRTGEVVAVVSDAGMPALSDPGARLVAMAAGEDITVEVVPGPFAGVVALVASGLLDPSGRFCFEGFLPRKGPTRSARIDELAAEQRTAVLYEAPHRLARTVDDLCEVLGADRRVALARELTKRYEEVWRGTLGEAVRRCGEVEPRGEYVVVLGGAAPPPDVDDESLRAALQAALDAGASRRDAAAEVAHRFDVAPNRVKRLLTGEGPAHR